LIASLKRLPDVAVVASVADAEATLTGNGEIWIQGYQSLNPRSGRSPADGKPIYRGYLSVELKDSKGDTLWSYLVTPKGGSENISRDLSKQIAKHLAEALASGKGLVNP
jgi:hypothetical protein